MAVAWEKAGAGRPFQSVAAFEDFVGRYREIGISEFVFYWPGKSERDQFEQIAREIIPGLQGH